jgi:hypothetical protein
MFLNHIDKILQAMPDVKNAYFLPFYESHVEHFKGIDEYESQSITIEDRKRFLIFQSQCGPCVTAFLHNRPVAVFGIMFHWQGMGEAYSMLTEESRRYPIAMTKAAHAFFDSCQILFNLHRIQITVKCEDKRAVQWAKALRFISEGVMVKYSADQEDTYIMRRI